MDTTQLTKPHPPAVADPPAPAPTRRRAKRRMPLREHLRELRNRVAKAMLGVFLGTVVGWKIHGWLIAHLTGPSCHIPGTHGIAPPTPDCPNGLMVMQGVMTPLTFTFKVALAAGVVISSPIWSYQLWAFAAPGLHRHEKRYAIGFVAAAVPLFLGGAGLAYWVFPQALKILLGFTPESFSNSLQGDQFLDFFIRMILVFGVSFEMPLFLVLLNFTGVVSAQGLTARWRTFVMGIFVFSALATPTGDPFSMVVLAVPMTVLFVLALGVVRWRERVLARRGGTGALSPDEASPMDLTPSQIEPSERTGD
ncbi:twin-arginine translocase subunit TatC [Streptomyces melanogenes]|uniref:twin-arginine translocase subunit TatC n=1 Tax=Streptomyces melanogenes TaxID=67326 RepID=UPI00167E6DA1|nr:twin-arginine translocase subunit TatC [Streptomyces melanogenes]GGP92430.1 Sec-independent protein translocase protein TatC [Streptomyces melanogenes]